METAQVLKIHEELARRTLAPPTQRPKRRYRLVCAPGGLRAGVEAGRSPPGSHTPGGDGSTKRHIDRRTAGREPLVQALQTARRRETDRPPPVNRVDSPKANGQRRPVGLAGLRDRAGQATVNMVLAPSYESVGHPFSGGFRPLRSTHHALRALRRGPADPTWGFQWIIAGASAACCEAIDHRLLRQMLNKRIQDHRRLDLMTRLVRGGIGEEGQVR